MNGGDIAASFSGKNKRHGALAMPVRSDHSDAAKSLISRRAASAIWGKQLGSDHPVCPLSSMVAAAGLIEGPAAHRSTPACLHCRCALQRLNHGGQLKRHAFESLHPRRQPARGKSQDLG